MRTSAIGRQTVVVEADKQDVKIGMMEATSTTKTVAIETTTDRVATRPLGVTTAMAGRTAAAGSDTTLILTIVPALVLDLRRGTAAKTKPIAGAALARPMLTVVFLQVTTASTSLAAMAARSLTSNSCSSRSSAATLSAGLNAHSPIEV